MKVKRIISRIFFPEKCSVCGEIMPLLQPYCSHCGVDSQKIRSDACKSCGHEKCICSADNPAPVKNFTAVYLYQEQLKKSILSFKFEGESSYSLLFGKAMAERLKEVFGDISFDGVCYVPMSRKTEAVRGYNQSELLARQVAKSLRLPVADCLEKTKDNRHQKDLTAIERFENVKGAFCVRKPQLIKNKTLILCDDIRTTGSTLNQCCLALTRAGAKEIYCLCLALTPYKESDMPF